MEKACSIKHVCNVCTIHTLLLDWALNYWALIILGAVCTLHSYVGVGGGGEVNVVTTYIHMYMYVCV